MSLLRWTNQDQLNFFFHIFPHHVTVSCVVVLVLVVVLTVDVVAPGMVVWVKEVVVREVVVHGPSQFLEKELWHQNWSVKKIWKHKIHQKSNTSDLQQKICLRNLENPQCKTSELESYHGDFDNQKSPWQKIAKAQVQQVQDSRPRGEQGVGSALKCRGDLPQLMDVTSLLPTPSCQRKWQPKCATCEKCCKNSLEKITRMYAKNYPCKTRFFFVLHLFEFSQLVGWLVDSPSCAPQCIFASCLDSDDARHILRNRHQGGSLGKTIHRQHVETTFRLRLNQDLGATNLHLVEDLDAAQHEILGFSTFETVGDREGRLQRHRHRRCSRVPFGDQQLRQRCWRHLKRVFFFQTVRECAKRTQNTKHPFKSSNTRKR